MRKEIITLITRTEHTKKMIKKNMKKKKKNISKELFILMVAFLSALTLSCGKGSSEEDNSIIGTWRYDWGSGPRSFTAYTFKDDGMGLMYDKGNPGEPFTYIYDAKSREIVIIYSPYNKETMIVSKLTSSILVMDGEEYKRVSSIDAY